ncbi:MAG: DUF4364 family protein, partial [Ruminococcus sp.]|nr:DUF4364 family protein [Ruminococcus sp.]
DFMAFDTFDEGISLGGIRSKTEVRILICYLFTSVKEPMSKETVMEALLEKGLTNYFEASSCFDDLVKSGNLAPLEENSKLYIATTNGKLISEQLEDNIALTVKERAIECAMGLLEKEKNEKENKVTIEKLESGYNVKCTISGGDIELMSVSLFLADYEQARIVKKNFYKNPQLFYKVMLASMTRNNSLIKDTLEDLKALS